MSVDLSALRALENHHRARCSQYDRFVRQEFPSSQLAESIEEFPFLPVAAFKLFELKSVAEQDVYRVMHSSGTGGTRSKVFLDRETAFAQSTALAKILTQEFGTKRLPMIVVQGTHASHDGFTASSAAVNGFSLMASKRLEVSLAPNSIELEAIQSHISGGPSIIFGFTFNVWIFIDHLRRLGLSNFLPNCLVIHGGGWKKLESSKVSPLEFNELAKGTLGASRVANYYGLVEQTGTIFMECVFGRMHEPSSGGLVIRDPKNLKPLPSGEIGLIQVVSTIQKSYPGHSILTEDLGSWSPESDCACGSKGKILKVIGRAKQAEVRGCSDAQLS